MGVTKQPIRTITKINLLERIIASMTNYTTKIRKIQEGEIPKSVKYKYVKMIKSRDIIDVTKMSWRPKANIKKISKTEYLTGYYQTDGNFISETGEVFEMEIKEKQMRNRRSLRKIFTDLRQLIYTNFSGSEREIFLTLTYAEQTNDSKQIHNDLKKFMQKLYRKYPDTELGYIAIVEPHASGNYHIHLLLQSMSSQDAPWTSDVDELGRELYQVWGHGYVLVEHLDCDNIGAYFVAYFSNMELSEAEAEEYKDDITEKNGKKYIKGMRLDFYPDYMKIYRNSRNMKKPTEIVALKDCEKTYSSTSELTTGDRTMYITKEQYKEK